MSYTPTNWQTGDVVTAQKLNNMENGIMKGEPLWLTLNEDETTGTLSIQGATLDEAIQFANNGGAVYLKSPVPNASDLTSFKVYNLSNIEVASDYKGICFVSIKWFMSDDRIITISECGWFYDIEEDEETIAFNNADVSIMEE